MDFPQQQQQQQQQQQPQQYQPQPPRSRPRSPRLSSRRMLASEAPASPAPAVTPGSAASAGNAALGGVAAAGVRTTLGSEPATRRAASARAPSTWLHGAPLLPPVRATAPAAAAAPALAAAAVGAAARSSSGGRLGDATPACLAAASSAPVPPVAATPPPAPETAEVGPAAAGDAAPRTDGGPSALELLMGRVEALETQAHGFGDAITMLQAENKALKRSILLWDLTRVRAHTKPMSVLRHPEPTCWPHKASLLTVMRLEGFERLIAQCVTPATRNKRFAGKVGWNKLQKTCSDLRYAPVSLDLDPSVRIVPDNFPTIRRAVQNVDRNDPFDQGRILVRPRAEPYLEQLVIDRRVTLTGSPNEASMPVIQGRVCVDESGAGTVLRGLTVRNTNPRDPWGSAVDVSGARNVLIEGCELSSYANDETAPGVIGISIDGAATATVVDNKIFENDVGVRLQPSGTATIRGNLIARNQKGLQLNDSGLEAIVEQGGFGRIMLRNNTFVDNRDGHDDASFLQRLEVLLHPLLRRFSINSTGSDLCRHQEEEDSDRKSGSPPASPPKSPSAPQPAPW